MEIINLLEFVDRAQLRAWLAANHNIEKQCWVVAYLKRKPTWSALAYIDIVEEALCFGWIDSTKKKMSDGRLAQRLSPRRKGSHWTELNKQRCADLECRGLMTGAGRRVLPAGSGDVTFETSACRRRHCRDTWSGPR